MYKKFNQEIEVHKYKILAYLLLSIKKGVDQS
jgi:hypothetical protein